MHWTHGDVTDYDQRPPRSATGQSPSSNLPTSSTALPNLGLPPLALPPLQGLPNLDPLNLRRPSSRQAPQGPATTRSAPSSPFYPDRPESSAATTTSSGTPKKRRRAASWNEAAIPHHHPSNPFSHLSHTYPSTPPLPDPDSDSEGSRAEFPGTPSASSPFKRTRTPFPNVPPGRAPHQPPPPTHPHPDPLALPSYRPPPLLHNLQPPLYMTRSAPNPSTASSSHGGNPRDSPPLWPSSPLHRSRDAPQWPSSPLQRSSHQHHSLPPRHHPRPHPSGPPYPTQPRHQHLHDDQHAYQHSSSPSQYPPQQMHPQPTPSHPQHDPASHSDHRRRPRHPPSQQHLPHPDQYPQPTRHRHGSPQDTHYHHRQSPTHPQHQQQPYPYYSSQPPAAHPSTRHNASSRFSTSRRQAFDPTPAPHDPSTRAPLYPRHASGPLSSTPAGSSSQHHFTHPDPPQTQLTHMDRIDYVDPFDQFDQDLAWGVQQPASASSLPKEQPSGTHESPPFDRQPVEQQPFDQQHFDQQPVGQQPFDQQHFDQQPVGQQPFDQDILDHLGLDQDFDAEQLFDQHLTSTFGQYPLEEAPSSQQHQHQQQEQQQEQQQQQQQQAHAVAIRSEYTGGPASWPGAGGAVSAELLPQGAGSPVAQLQRHHQPLQPQQPQQYHPQPHPELLPPPQPHAQQPRHDHHQPQSQPQPQPHALQPHLPQQLQQQGGETAELATTLAFEPHSSLPGTPEPPPFIDPAPTPDTPPPDPPPMPTPQPQYDPMHLDSGSCNPSPSAPPLPHPSPLSPAPLVTPTPTADAADAWPRQASTSSQPTPSQATASSTVHSLQRRSPHPRAGRPPLSQPEAWPDREGSTSLPPLPSQHSRDLSVTDMYNELVSIHALPNLPPLPDRPRPPSPRSFPQSYAAPMRGPSPNYDASWPDVVSFRDRSPSRPQALPGPHSWGQPGGSGSFRHKMHYGTGLQLAESASQAASQGPRLPSPPSKWPIPISSGTHPQMWHQPPSVPVYDPQYWPRDNQSSDSS